MENEGKLQLSGNLQLPDKPFFLIFPGRVHAVEIQPDFPPGLDPWVLRQFCQKIKFARIALTGIMGMISNCSVNARVGLSYFHGARGCFFVDADGHYARNTGLARALDDPDQIFAIGLIIQVAVTVKYFHFIHIPLGLKHALQAISNVEGVFFRLPVEPVETVGRLNKEYCLILSLRPANRLNLI
jgi:hypothetical protein